ncbi:MAG: hypothetical protein FT726_04625 [Pantoea sp. Morm]|uniref:hypothetical protein n=1 Tax=Pantoea sp. Morm TaxID=2601250 RepID=UPI001DB80E8D|nr:hypothetical protein [Pantoea sp. Morm]
MNTHNVNVNTATPESPKTWVKGDPIPGLSAEVAENLASLNALSGMKLTRAEMREFLHVSLHDLMEALYRTQVGNMLPQASMRALVEAAHIVHDGFGEAGDVLWGNACSRLKDWLTKGRTGGQQA